MVNVDSAVRAGRLACAAVTADALDVTAHAALVEGATSGAVATFAGVIRNHDHGREVVGIDYSAHPSAERILTQLAEDVISEFGVDAVAVSHRVGSLGIGDVALAVAVASAHRREAIAAASELVERVKATLPVWKHQFFADGTDEWVNCC